MRTTAAWAISRAACLLTVLTLASAPAQTSNPSPKPTELVVRRFEKLQLRGDLLTPGGWERASKLFVHSEPYPRDGEIQVTWTGTRTIGEDWVRGDSAQVETKWNDWYGIIDSALQFKSETHGSIVMAETFSLVLVHPQLGADGEWKIEGPLKTRSADIPQVIRYLEKRRDESNDPVLRKNAEKSIATLKRQSASGCGSASAC